MRTKDGDEIKLDVVEDALPACSICKCVEVNVFEPSTLRGDHGHGVVTSRSARTELSGDTPERKLAMKCLIPPHSLKVSYRFKLLGERAELTLKKLSMRGDDGRSRGAKGIWFSFFFIFFMPMAIIRVAGQRPCVPALFLYPRHTKRGNRFRFTQSSRVLSPQ